MTENILHLRKDGNTEYIELDKLNLSTNSTDAEIRQAVIRYKDLPAGSLDNDVIERLGNDLSVRPQASYG
jgi:hypothetical protein